VGAKQLNIPTKKRLAVCSEPMGRAISNRFMYEIESNPWKHNHINNRP
jgi:hypothetical protein